MTAAWQSWNGSARLHGIDLARALAVIGMLAAHLLTIEESLELARPETWVDLVNGRSSILFAVLAGVSLALVTGGTRPRTGIPLRIARRRIAVRAALLWVIGVGLILTGVPVYVILPAYAILFLVALPLLRLPVRALWVSAVAVLLVMPWFLPALEAATFWDTDLGYVVFLISGWAYPFPLWIGFVLLGLAIGRSDLRSVWTQGVLLGGGVAAAVAAGMAAIVIRATGAVLPGSDLEPVWSAEAHSGGLIEVIGSAGTAVAVLGACLLLCRTRATWVLTPLRAVGAMPLTAYAGQIVVWAIAAGVAFGDTTDLWSFRELQPFGWFVLGVVVFCFAWGSLLGQGPLERLLGWAARRAVPDERQDAAVRVEQ